MTANTYCEDCRGYHPADAHQDEARQAHEAEMAAQWADVAAGDAHLAATEGEDPCDDGCHLAGGEPVLIMPQPDAASYGEPVIPVPCCRCWNYRPCASNAPHQPHGLCPGTAPEYPSEPWGDADDRQAADEEAALMFPECPACGGPGMHLGTLGRREHFRCRDCGIDFSRKEDR